MYVHTCVSLGLCRHVNGCPWRALALWQLEWRAVVSHQTWVTGNWTLVLCRSSQHSYPLTHPPAPGMGYFLKSSWKPSGFYYIATGLTFPSPRSLLLSWRLVLWRCLPGFSGCPLWVLCHYAHRVLPKQAICSSGISNYLEIAWQFHAIRSSLSYVSSAPVTPSSCVCLLF